MRWVLPSLLVVLASCGSSWQIRKGDELVVGCAEKAFYPDADGDGWGDANAEPVASCTPPGDGFTASNGRDCDDGNPAITGRVGAVCPDALLTSSAPIDYEGVIYDQSEFVFVFGVDTPTARYAMAESSCQDWSGMDEIESEWVPRGGLATFNSQAELQEVQDRVEEVTTHWAGFIGIHWEGGLQNGDWSWTDDSSDALINAIPWCGGQKPLPEDFFPNLNPADPEHAPGIEKELEHIRLALVLQEGGSWCLGLPVDALPADLDDSLEDAGPWPLLTHTEAHFICERLAPDPSAYQEFSVLKE